ncbi:MAG: glycosyltransferase [Candidatus Eisenbacteria bacterium]
MPRTGFGATLSFRYFERMGGNVRLLYVSEVQWLSQVSRKHLIIRRLPKDWDVLFVSPLNAVRSENSLRPRSDETYPNVRYASLPLPKPDSGIAFVRGLTRPLAAVGTRRLAWLARSFRPNVIVCSYLWAAPAVPAFRARGIPVVYDLNDLHPEFYPKRRREADEMFRSMLSSVDEVVSSSDYLRDVARRGVVIGNGVDLDAFAGRTVGPMPKLLADSPLSACEDLVAYVGSVDDRVDFGLLEAVGRRISEASRATGLVVIGRVFDSVAARVRALERSLGERVLFTGRVPYERLPELMSSAKVGIAPFVLSERTRAINPNKLYMYAAMDMNVVTTPFSSEVKRHRDVVFVASGRDEFAAAVDAALGDDDRRRAIRKSIALPNSWNRKANSFADLLSRLSSG